MNWKQCKSFIVFELKHTPLFIYLVQIFTAAVFGLMYAQVLPGFLEEEQPAMIIDLLLLIAIGVNVYLIRYYPFFIREVKTNFYVAPVQILLRQMPLTDKTIIVSRMMTMAILSVLASIIFLSVFYIFFPAEELTAMFPNYFSFSMGWILLVLAASGMIAASEPGDWLTKMYITIWSIGALMIVFAGPLFIRFATGQFIFEWMIDGAAQWPVLFPFLVLPITVGSLFLCVLIMKRYMKKTDYHV